ncbi:MAG: ABC transporter ATP-binding protein [Actinobacteria bacterium]|nr:ABC transporter ATP-binding protein [Actinomycetota bacterium]
MTQPLLSVRDLHVNFGTGEGDVQAVRGVSFDIGRGETLAIVGESGSGKSVTASAIMRLNFGADVRVSGSALFEGQDILAMSEEEVRLKRGSDIAMIFQDPLTALNPFYTVGNQIAEAYAIHHPGTSKKELRDLVLDSISKVGIPEPLKRINQYPHEFSGGMRQRIVIAMALINRPKLLIADEPTTALDVTVQAQILELISAMQEEHGSAVILITHDLGVVAEVTKRVLVMYAGRLVEVSSVEDVFSSPTHPYTRGLLNSVRSLDSERHSHLEPIPGTPPSLIDLPSGCPFHSRCQYAASLNGRCISEVPELKAVGNSFSACHLPTAELSSLVKAAQ